MKNLSRFSLILGLIWIFSRTAIYFLPGSPAEFLYHESLVQTSIADLTGKMDLQHSAWHRILHLPNENSLITGQAVLPLVSHALLHSLVLAFLTLLFTSAMVTFSLYQSFRSPKLKRFFDFISLLITSIPLIILGPAILLLGCLVLKWFPAANHPLLPALTLSLYLSSSWHRTLSAEISSYLPRSAVLGARSRGQTEAELFFHSLYIPALGKFAAFLGTQMSLLVNGSILVEIVFQWNGLGNLLANAILSRDYPIIEISLMTLTVITLLSQQLGYALQKQWEPKLR
jgi:peptide/nickel transport system permease protein